MIFIFPTCSTSVFSLLPSLLSVPNHTSTLSTTSPKYINFSQATFLNAPLHNPSWFWTPLLPSTPNPSIEPIFFHNSCFLLCHPLIHTLTNSQPQPSFPGLPPLPFLASSLFHLPPEPPTFSISSPTLSYINCTLFHANPSSNSTQSPPP
uniref:Uncharacterized protein n=1 Tax=Octopus bimaculoides TaxID=37653 RepID=A0A0L8G1H8_OCTBM